MAAGRVARIPGNVRLDGCDLAGMFAWLVAEIGGFNLVGYLQMRIGCWELAIPSEKVVEN
jgi:hypothetical protein